ncbi:LuxR family transcriptional regulator [Aeromonas jandaei]|uniref:helix-turn-helix transcriptional regulator n=1 Tax=Aeromonas jandaei TaxID=650 RepID=UPI00191CB37F|nr:LuxR C-terminal-related transcriptional regulator [Aeromonas jandaei]MBL0599098.1 LuxR family transcriptional regulator [Aeromonas jandaei]
MEKNIDFYYDNPIIQHDVGILLVKDTKHRFVASNYGFSTFSGMEPERVIGLSDYDMPWCDQANIYLSHEKDILSGLSYSVIEPLAGIKKTNLITKKKIIYDDTGIPRGTIATALPLMIDIDYCNLSGTSEILRVADYGMGLTKKESLVLYYVIKGFKRARVAELARISTSAFDFHIRNIKFKFGVNNVSELNEIIYTKGLQDIIPFVIKQ